MDGKKRRKQKRKPTPRPRAYTPAEYWKRNPLVHSLVKVHRSITFIAAIPLAYLLINSGRLFNKMPGLLYASITIICVSSFLKIPVRNALVKLYSPSTPISDAKYHFMAVLGLTLNIFAVVAMVIPILHDYGYIERSLALVPSTTKIGMTTAVVLAFVGGAAVSGIIGNFTYDVVKYVVLKKMGKTAKRKRYS
jgi:hypothetical protein